MPKVKTKSNNEQEEVKSPEKQNEEDVQTMLTEMGEGPAPEEQENNDEQPEGSQEQEQEETTEEREEQEGTEEQEEQEEPSKDEIIERLRAEVNELSQGQPAEEQGREQTENNEEEEEQPEEQVLQFENQEFVTEEEFDEIIQDRDKLNAVLNKVAFQSAQAAREAVLRQVPDVVSKTTNRQMSVRQAVQSFYNENPDLREYGSYVGHIANRVKADNPDLSMGEILNKAGAQARQKLNIQKEAREQEEERRGEENPQDGPAFAKRGSGRREGGKQDDLTDFQKQADEMLNSL